MAASSGDTVIQLVVATAGSGVLVAAIQGFFTRRKTKAEAEGAGATATKMITDAAASVVVTIQADNTALRGEVALLRREVGELRDWKDAAEDLLGSHGLVVHVTPPRGVKKRAT